MTVEELLDVMIGAFKGFDAGAVTAMAPVFARKLGRYEGAELGNAWVEVAASFKPTAAKPYPLPSDYEDVLPRAVKMPKGTSAAALDFKGRAERKAALVADWNQWQRPAIAEQFGPRVAFWCEQEVRGRAGTLAWKDEAATVRLGSDDIAKIFESVVSRDRMDTFGVVGHPETWRDQFEQCRAHVVAGRFSRDEIAEPLYNSREFGRNSRTFGGGFGNSQQNQSVGGDKSAGKSPSSAVKSPTVDLRPEEFTEVPPVPAWLDDGAPPAEEF